MGFKTNLFEATRLNTDFRRVLFTTERSQLVLMCVQPGDDIGLEVHDLDQTLVFVAGEGESLLAGEKGRIGPGTVVVVPAGTEHNFTNTGREPLRLFTVYAPAEHADGTIHRTKAEAEAAEAAEEEEKAHQSAPGGFSVGSLRRQPQR